MTAIKRQRQAWESEDTARSGDEPVMAAAKTPCESFVDGSPSREMGARRTALAYEPGRGKTSVERIAVEFDERGQWAVVVDDVVLRYLPDATTAIEDARRLENLPTVAAIERDRALRHAKPRRRR